MVWWCAYSYMSYTSHIHPIHTSYTPHIHPIYIPYTHHHPPHTQIPHLKQLGINAIELLPVFDWDELEFQRLRNPREHMVNIWGYSHLTFMAIAPRLASTGGGDPSGAAREFKEMVRAFHENGIEVILDVVYNHTAEGRLGCLCVCGCMCGCLCVYMYVHDSTIHCSTTNTIAHAHQHMYNHPSQPKQSPFTTPLTTPIKVVIMSPTCYPGVALTTQATT